MGQPSQSSVDHMYYILNQFNLKKEINNLQNKLNEINDELNKVKTNLSTDNPIEKIRFLCEFYNKNSK
jgi:lipid II:glycine glycyltransferase (peptidoglycan interpeptide bridge formation enzyme)